MDENVCLTTVRGEPKTPGGRLSQLTPLLGFTTTVVKLLALPLSPVQLSVNVTVCAVAGIVTDTDPVARFEVPVHPPVRVQVKLLPKSDAVQLMFDTALTTTELGLALIATETPAPAVFTVATPVVGLMVTAASIARVISCMD